MPLDRFSGMIAASGFSDGNACVVGIWRQSPLGRLVDVMWRTPDGERVLLAPHEEAAHYIGSLYRFDRIDVVGVRGGWDGTGVAVEAGPLRLRLDPAPRDWRSLLFRARPEALTRRPRWIELEDRLGRPFVSRLIGGAEGVRAAGRAPGGQREWYGVRDYRRVRSGRLTVDGRDAGAIASLPANLGVGLSAFPTAPALVSVTTLIEPVAGAPTGSASAR